MTTLVSKVSLKSKPILVAHRSRIATACMGPHITINSKLKPQLVDIVPKGFHTVWKSKVQDNSETTVIMTNLSGSGSIFPVLLFLSLTAQQSSMCTILYPTSSQLFSAFNKKSINFQNFRSTFSDFFCRVMVILRRETSTVTSRCSGLFTIGTNHKSYSKYCLRILGIINFQIHRDLLSLKLRSLKLPTKLARLVFDQ